MTINQGYTRTNNCIFKLDYHMVLVVKRRRPILTAAMLEDAEMIARARCKSHDGQLHEFNGEEDHLHLLLSLPPAVSLASFVNALKTSTSRALRRDYPGLRRYGPALWQPSYFVSSVGGAGLETVKNYVRAQKRPD